MSQLNGRNGRSGRHVVLSTRCYACGNAIVPFPGVMMPTEGKAEAHKVDDSRAVGMQFSTYTVI